MAFVHLHVHSEYSMLDGACRLRDLPSAVAAHGQDAVALTDHGNMFGAVAFYKACKSVGVKPIIGCEVYVAPVSRIDKDPTEKYHHLILLCENETGYKNLSKLVSAGFLEGMYAKPRVDDELLSRYHEGLIALSGCVAGRIPQQILADDHDGAKESAEKYESIFGKGNFYLEIQNHFLPEEEKVRAGMIELSRQTGIPLAATNDAHYIRRADAETQKILMCVQTGSTIEKGSPLSFPNDEFYLKSTEEMTALFPDAPQAVENTAAIAARCHFDFDFSERHLPSYPLPQGKNAKDVLSALAEKGLNDKKEKNELDLAAHTFDDYKYRMIYELMMIAKMGYSDYFLIVQDFVNAAKNMDVTVGPGRGSGAGSLVAYLIGITEVDPVVYDLLFERFLNPERVSMPDFDIDFCDVGRDRVIEYVADKYGRDHVAQIAAFGTLGAKAAVHDAGRVLGVSPREIDAISKLIPQRPDMTIDRALEIKELNEVYQTSDSIRQLIDVAHAIEGFPRSISTHAAGVVITEQPIVDYMPVAVSSGAVLTQYDMNTVAELGLLKFDFLALRYLTVIENAEKAVRISEPDFDIKKIPPDDKETMDRISAGETEGLFQLESAGMTRMLTQLKPRSIKDLMIAIAVYRPGPMDSIPALLEARSGKARKTQDIPQLDEILADTSGVIIYQEQVMQIFRRVAGYSFGRADIVRRAMAKKHANELEREREGFLTGAQKNGVSADDAGTLFDRMASFASYAFNKSHAAAYALVAYRTAYLKAHYPREYIAALLTSVSGDTVKTAEYVGALEKRGFRLLPPDVNQSEASFTPTPEGLRFGLFGIKNLGYAFVESLISERQKNGPYKNPEDFLMRCRQGAAGRMQMLSLIGSGAFDSFRIPRSRMTEGLDDLISFVSERQRRISDAQIDLFAAAGETQEENSFSYPEVAEYPRDQLLQTEKELTGMWFSGHPLGDYKKNIAQLHPDRISRILSKAENGIEGETVSVCGIILSFSIKTSKAGNRFAVLQIEDESGGMEALVFEKTLENSHEFIKKDAAVYVRGKLSALNEKEPKLTAFEILPLIDDEALGELKHPGVQEDDATRKTESKADKQDDGAQAQTYKSRPEPAGARKERKLYIRLSGDERIDRRVRAIVEIFDGTTPCIFYDQKSKKYSNSGRRVAVSAYILDVLKKTAGEENVVLK